MKRHENQGDRPATGFRPVPLFNQKKRARVPLTSAPSENEFFSHSEYRETTSSSGGSGAYGCYQASSPPAATAQSHQWNKQNTPQAPRSQPYGSKPAPGPAHTMRNYAPMPHPYKAPGAGSKVGQPSTPVRQQESSPSPINSRQSEYRVSCFSESPQSKPMPHTGFPQKAQPSFNRGPNPTHQYSQQSRPAPVPSTSRPGAPAAPKPNSGWNFKNSFGSQKTSLQGNGGTNPSQTVRPAQTQQAALPVKAAPENSLRILTAVIAGMRHWSQFKDKMPFLFEVFATLDSAVTLGRHGAKNFLLRDGKHVVQCVYYDNEKELPRLIRGHLHRCVGSYDSSSDVLKCVSVRPGLPSEQRNALETVKACDAEMRRAIKSFCEV